MHFLKNIGFKKINKDKYLYTRSCFSRKSYVLSKAEKEDLENTSNGLLNKMPFMIIPMFLVGKFSLVLSMILAFGYTFIIVFKMILYTNRILRNKEIIKNHPIGFLKNFKAVSESMTPKQLLYEFRYAPAFLFVMYFCIFISENSNIFGKMCVILMLLSFLCVLLGMLFFSIKKLWQSK